ncbi:hypothetical protein J5N58_25150 [Rhizobium cremeum]|nr:hypothetical protein [Rhizobium cremeum]MCJ7997882.1 hypothetical protein [Rhizobium cremeum]MCJ8002975.1 hypothetical protein [Rhizobium cremeum]
MIRNNHALRICSRNDRRSSGSQEVSHLGIIERFSARTSQDRIDASHTFLKACGYRQNVYSSPKGADTLVITGCTTSS